ncbi:hypothetical protein EDD16DRAFT_760710 [Pisolithus croceorrhizus]|nr:hypothetical protein EDD16DRAFT_760710 [Pisolithus croceorrhizus]
MSRLLLNSISQDVGCLLLCLLETLFPIAYISESGLWSCFLICDEFYSLHGLPISLVPLTLLTNPSQCLCCPSQCNLPSSILLNRVLVQGGWDNLQESLTLAVKEYQSSGIHAKVNESIQKAFEKYGDNVDNLCPVLVHIAKENQLCAK